MLRRFGVGLAAMLGFGVGATALAQPANPPGDGAARAACGPDVQRLCPGVPPGDGRLRSCMAGKMDQLSATCREAMQAQRAARPRGG